VSTFETVPGATPAISATSLIVEALPLFGLLALGSPRDRSFIGRPPGATLGLAKAQREETFSYLPQKRFYPHLVAKTILHEKRFWRKNDFLSRRAILTA
jgi:hypothetical protein